MMKFGVVRGASLAAVACTEQSGQRRTHWVEQVVLADDPLLAIEAMIDWEVIRERMAPFDSLYQAA